jgi:RNase adaptor protein for sRNA GlmZ degradation
MMNWYSKTTLAASAPPAYMLERISDLRHACDLSGRAPGEAKKVIMEVVSQLSVHNDSPYAKHLTDAAEKMLDSPKLATEAIKKVISVMISEKEEHDAELEVKKNNGKGRDQ